MKVREIIRETRSRTSASRYDHMLTYQDLATRIANRSGKKEEERRPAMQRETAAWVTRYERLPEGVEVDEYG